ncbi:MAG: hypothetical protein MJA84_15145 [Firmicutes bacterium]|nr:hypothetical protein [Bacillota bacterium]
MQARIKELALNKGVDVIKFTSPEPFDNPLLDSTRRDPHQLLPSAQTLIICGIYIGEFEMPNARDPHIGQLSRLILSNFYFDVVEPLDVLVSLLKNEGYSALQCGGYPDSYILPLKLAAVRAGFGWQGKNTLLITKGYGSFIALGGIITDASFELDNVKPERDGCGNCEACQKACPVDALKEPYKLNVSRCLSSLLEGAELSAQTKKAMGNMIMECDLCQVVCPWNKKLANAPVKSNYKWSSHERFGNLNDFFKMSNLIKLSEEEFNKYLGYGLVGIDYHIFRRNLIVAMLNSQDEDNLQQLKSLNLI